MFDNNDYTLGTGQNLWEYGAGRLDTGSYQISMMILHGVMANFDTKLYGVMANFKVGFIRGHVLFSLVTIRGHLLF